GLDHFITREMARDRSLTGKYYYNATALRVVVSIIVLLVIVVGAYLISLSGEAMVLVLAAAIYAMLKTNSFTAKSVFRTYEKMELEAIPTVLGSIVIAGVGITGLWLGLGLFGIGIALVIGGIVDLVASLTIMSIKKMAPGKQIINPDFIKEIFLSSTPFWFMVMIVAVYFSTDIFMISFLLGEKAVGFYSAAFKPLAATILIAGSVVAALYPKLSRQYAESAAKLKKTFIASFKILLMASIPLTIATILFAGQITDVLYGSGFGPTKEVFLVLGVLPVLLFVNMLLATTMNAVDRQKTNMLNALAITILNIALNFVLITEFGLIGAAYATIASQILFLVLSAQALLKPLMQH
ncbi:MAG: oligosaccharide flippase family protein, partial [Candidatus Diapherotrites archaeon]